MSITSLISSSSSGKITPPSYHLCPYYYPKGWCDPLFLPLVDFKPKLPPNLEQALLKAPAGTYYLDIQNGLVKAFYVVESITTNPNLHPQKELDQVAFRRLNHFEWEVVFSNQVRLSTAFSSWEECLKSEGQHLLQMPLHQYLQQNNRSQLIDPKHFVSSANLAYDFLSDSQISEAGSYLFTQDNADANVFYLMYRPFQKSNNTIYQIKIEFADNGCLILKDSNNQEISRFAYFENFLAYSRSAYHLTNPPSRFPLPTFDVAFPPFKC